MIIICKKVDYHVLVATVQRQINIVHVQSTVTHTHLQKIVNSSILSNQF